MATALAQPRLFYRDQQLHGQATSLSLDVSGEALDATTFADDFRVRTGGVKDAAIQIEGLWDAPPDAALFAALGQLSPFMAASDNVVGAPAYALNSFGATYSPSGEHGELFRFSLTIQGDGPIVQGALALDQLIAASGVGTALNLGAVAGSQFLYAALFVTAFTGTSLDVDVESDDAQVFTTPTTRASFAQVAAPGSEWLTPVAGAIADTWWRMAFTFVGTSATAHGFIGIQ